MSPSTFFLALSPLLLDFTEGKSVLIFSRTDFPCWLKWDLEMKDILLLVSSSSFSFFSLKYFYSSSFVIVDTLEFLDFEDCLDFRSKLPGLLMVSNPLRLFLRGPDSILFFIS